MPPSSVTIVGAGAAGLGTAEYLRAAGFAGAITVVGDEVGEPYDRPPLSKQVLSGVWSHEKAALFAPARLEAIKADPVYNNGNYKEQPPTFKYTAALFGLATGGGREGGMDNARILSNAGP